MKSESVIDAGRTDALPSMRGLQAFQVLAEVRHFGQAAERLGISQPPLSIRIRQLEAQLGARLFQRSRAGVRLTAAGEALAAEVEPLLERLSRALDRVRAIAAGSSGELRVGFVTTAEFSFLPERLSEFRRRFPQVRLHLTELTSDAQFVALSEGRLDVGFVLAPVPALQPTAVLDWRLIARERLVVALPSEHPLARRRGAVAAAELAGDPLVIFPRDKAPNLHDQIMSVFPPGHVPVIGQEAIQMPTIVSLVAAGLGIAIVPESLRNLGRRGVVYRALASPTPVVETAVCWRRDEPAATARRFVADLVGDPPEGAAPMPE